jgi:ribonuclease P/MRP protein subunit POP1
MAGWTLTIPAGWGMAFWQSLVFSETRVGGLRERSQSFFEAGAAKFPEDYPGTAAFVEYETAREVDDRGFWEKKPPAKRANYLNSKTVNPFQAGFDEILLRQSPSTVVATGIDPTLQGISPWIASVSITRLVMKLVQASIDAEQENNNMEIDVAAPSIIDRSNSTLAAASLAYLLVMGRKVALHETSKDATLFRSALVRVKILPCHRGAPKELALVYELDDEAWNEVRDNVGGSKGRKEAIARDQKDGPEEVGLLDFFSSSFEIELTVIDVATAVRSSTSHCCDWKNYDG